MIFIIICNLKTKKKIKSARIKKKKVTKNIAFF